MKEPSLPATSSPTAVRNMPEKRPNRDKPLARTTKTHPARNRPVTQRRVRKLTKLGIRFPTMTADLVSQTWTLYLQEHIYNTWFTTNFHQITETFTSSAPYLKLLLPSPMVNVGGCWEHRSNSGWTKKDRLPRFTATLWHCPPALFY